MRGPKVSLPPAAATAGLVAALTLSGCIGFDGTPTGKQISAKKVEVKFKICTGNSPPTCEDDDSPPFKSEDQEAKERGVGERVLIGIRTPHKADMPAKFTAQGEFAGPDTTFTYNKPYTDALNAAAPRPNGSRYTGYTAAGQIDPDKAAEYKARGEESFPFRVVLGLPDDIGKQFKWRPVVGFTFEEDPTIPSSCGKGSQVFTGNGQNPETTCVDGPDTFEETSRSLKIPLD